MQSRNYSDKVAVAANQNTKERDYWIQKLDGEPLKTYFPYDFTGKRSPDPAGGSMEESVETVMYPFTFESTVTEGLKKISGNVDVRLQMILVAGLVALLHKYTGREDILSGAPILKQKVEADFVNRILVLRVSVTPQTTFKELLNQVKNTIVDAAANQNFPIEVLPELINMPGTGEMFPLFETVSLLENIHDSSYLEGFPYSMLFSFNRDETGIEGKVFYIPRYYKEETVAQVVRHLSRLFERGLADVTTTIGEIQILSEEEKKQLLETFNGKKGLSPDGRIFSQLFEEQVARTPDNIAVVGRGAESQSPGTREEGAWRMVSLTYSRLNARSNRLARRLKEAGVGAGSIVGIMVERCPQMIVGVLAILKAGGAYLPIDPQYPPQRIAFMLEDSGTRLLVTQSHLKEIVQMDMKIVEIGDLDTEIPGGGENTENLEPAAQPTDLVYVIYTSGSTGKPKGVLIQQDHYLNVAEGWRQEYRLQEMEVRLLQMASFSFDVFAGDMARALLNGGQMVITPPNFLDPESLYQLIDEYRVTILESTPAYVMPFMEHVYDNLLPVDSLQLLILGSDSCPVRDFKRLVTRFGNSMRIVNSYGVTEAAIDSSFYEESDPEKIPSLGSVPIGKPLPNMTFYILDEGKKLLPIGVPGDLYVGGRSVAGGYLKREQLTAERFLPDPFSGDGRMYKTGDRARWLSDGNVEFLGRDDFQVKIRGYRIELGEIEAALLEHEAVKEAVVDRKSDDGDDYLCGYVVLHQQDFFENNTIMAETFRAYLGQKLTDYMVPWFYVSLEQMPLTPNGKIDRKGLPLPETSAPKEYVAPRNQKEEEMVRLWASVLSVQPENIGIDHNFFDLGGNSLKAIIMGTKIHKAMNVKVELTDVFKLQTVRELVKFVQEADEDIFVGLQRAPQKEFYPLSSAQKRLFLMQKRDLDSTAYNILETFGLPEEPDKERLEDTFKQLIRRHESFRTSFVMIDDEPMQQIHQEVDFQIRYMDPILKPGDMSDRLGDFKKPFDLSQAPLIRVGVVPVVDRGFYLLVDMHHIISDGVSQSILAGEFHAIFTGEALPPLNLQYKDYSEWLRSDAVREMHARQEDYWLDLFDGQLPVLDLPLDFQRPAKMSFEADSRSFRFKGELRQSIQQFIANEDVTLYMFLLAAFNVFLAKAGRIEDIVVGTVISGRNHADLDHIIGVFVNLLPMRNNPSGWKTFLDFLAEVKENTLKAFENQNYSFDELVEKVLDKRDIARHPLLDVGFTCQNFDVQAIDVSDPDEMAENAEIAGNDLQTPGSEKRRGYSKLDLNLEAYETPEKVIFKLQYCVDLFKEETIERFIQYFTNIVSSVIADPMQQIEEISLISKDEQESIRADITSSRDELEADFDL